MSTFLTGTELENAITDIIWDAEETLLILSPYIKLDDYFKKLFDKHIENPQLHIMIIFGKNEQKISRSMSADDFEYFKKFPNISIIHVPELHAKYYGNEKKGVITSINLYDYSFRNNIEYGVYSELSIIDRFRATADNEAWNNSKKIAEENDVVFIRRPEFAVNKSLLKTEKNYLSSKILHDSTDRFHSSTATTTEEKHRLNVYPTELIKEKLDMEKPER